MISLYLLAGLFYLLYGYFWLMVISVIMSWIPSLHNFAIFRLIDKIGGWYLQFFRGIVVFGYFDFTPIVGFLLFNFALETFSRLI